MILLAFREEIESSSSAVKSVARRVAVWGLLPIAPKELWRTGRPGGWAAVLRADEFVCIALFVQVDTELHVARELS